MTSKEKEAISRRLTEAMGECWHERTYKPTSPPVEPCIHCGSTDKNLNDFFTWQGFGKLWEWAWVQEWWQRFCEYTLDGDYYGLFRENLIHPTRFAVAVDKFLQGRG